MWMQVFFSRWTILASCEQSSNHLMGLCLCNDTLKFRIPVSTFYLTCSFFQIHLHDQGEVPQMKDLGFAAAPGTYTLVGVQRRQVQVFDIPISFIEFSCCCYFVSEEYDSAFYIYFLLSSLIWIIDYVM